MNRNLSIFAVLSVLLLSVLVVPVSASYGGNNIQAQAGNATEATEEPTQDNEVEHVEEQLSHGTDLVDYEFDQQNSSVMLHFRSDYTQTVVITDAFIPESDGVVDVNQQRIDVNGEKTVTFDITKVNGKMGVTMDAGEGLKAITERVGFTFNANYSAGQMFAIILISVAVGITLVFGVAYKRKLEHSEEIERIV